MRLHKTNKKDNSWRFVAVFILTGIFATSPYNQLVLAQSEVHVAQQDPDPFPDDPFADDPFFNPPSAQPPSEDPSEDDLLPDEPITNGPTAAGPQVFPGNPLPPDPEQERIVDEIRDGQRSPPQVATYASPLAMEAQLIQRILKRYIDGNCNANCTTQCKQYGDFLDDISAVTCRP